MQTQYSCWFECLSRIATHRKDPHFFGSYVPLKLPPRTALIMRHFARHTPVCRIAPRHLSTPARFMLLRRSFDAWVRGIQVFRENREHVRRTMAGRIPRFVLAAGHSEHIRSMLKRSPRPHWATSLYKINFATGMERGMEASYPWLRASAHPAGSFIATVIAQTSASIASHH